MLYKKIKLKDICPKITNESVTLRIYICERNDSVNQRPGMLICPGGGYSFCSSREAEPVALCFMSEGFNCFVLEYTTNEKYPAPHIDLAVAYSYIREHEEEFDLLPNSLSIVGFSAGGHLVASYGYLYKELAEILNIKTEILKPFSLVLSYPVITTSLMHTHQGTREIITNEEEALVEKLDIHRHIQNDYPPTFIWTTKDDDLVPSQNSVLMNEALENAHVKHEFKLYETGWHGLSIANNSCCDKGSINENMKKIHEWPSLASEFIFDLLNNR